MIWFWLLGCASFAVGCGDSVTESATAQNERPAHVPASRDAVTVSDFKRAAGNGDLDAGVGWPVFLGPHHTGVSDETGLLKRWPDDGPPLVWERRVGTGYSAPSILGDRLVLHHRIGGSERVTCFKTADGSQRWEYQYPSSFRDPYGYNNGPRCTPLLANGRCYTYGAAGMLACLNLETGVPIWTRDTQHDWQVPAGFFGVGATPILEGNLLIVLVGGQPNSGVVAFDPETGRTVWERVGKETWDGAETDWSHEPYYHWTGEEMLVSYSSPIAATIHGKRHLLCLMRQGLVSLDPQNGRLRFKHWFRARVEESVNAARPVVVGDKIFLSAAYRAGAALLQVHEDGAGYDVVWRNPRAMLTHWSTALYHDGLLYGFSGRHENEGTLRVIRLDTGELAWESDGLEAVADRVTLDRFGGGYRHKQTGKSAPYPRYGRGSAILADGNLIVLGERGTLALVRPNPRRLDEISRAAYPSIQHPSWTAPVLSHHRLYLRSEQALVCLDVGDHADAQ